MNDSARPRPQSYGTWEHPQVHAHIRINESEPNFLRLWWNPPSTSPADEDEVNRAREDLLLTIGDHLDEITEIRHVKDGTWQLTSALSGALARRGYDCYTELHFEHPFFEGHGRADIVAIPQAGRTLYIEIDSTPVNATIEKNRLKLQAAWMMGAIPVWIGWHKFDPSTITLDAPTAKLTVLPYLDGLVNEGMYRRSAQEKLDALKAAVDALITLTPIAGRCNAPTRDGKLCRREPGHRGHEPQIRTMPALFPIEVFEDAVNTFSALQRRQESFPGRAELEDQDALRKILPPKKKSPFDQFGVV